MLGGIQTLRDQQSNLQSLFILGVPVISVCCGRRPAYFLCLLSCEFEFWKCMKKTQQKQFKHGLSCFVKKKWQKFVWTKRPDTGKALECSTQAGNSLLVSSQFGFSVLEKQVSLYNAEPDMQSCGCWEAQPAVQPGTPAILLHQTELLVCLLLVYSSHEDGHCQHHITCLQLPYLHWGERSHETTGDTLNS